MEHRQVPGDPRFNPQWHRETKIKQVNNSHRLMCPCGTLLYEGKKPDFPRISCPTCKKVFEVDRS